MMNLNVTESSYSPSGFGLRLFLSLTIQGALKSLKIYGDGEEADDITKEMDSMLFDMIISASNVIVKCPIEA